MADDVRGSRCGSVHSFVNGGNGLRPRYLFFLSNRRRHTSSKRDWSSDVCSSDLSLTTNSTTSTADPAAIGPVDVVLFAVKLYDVESALASLPPLLGPDTAVVPLQNGVDSVAKIGRASCRESLPITVSGSCLTYVD